MVKKKLREVDYYEQSQEEPELAGFLDNLHPGYLYS
jgi:hypothetical protein